MEIHIQDSDKLSDIQKAFNDQFNYLKLEFFDVAESDSEEYSKDEMIKDTSKTLGAIRSKHNEGDLSINGHLKVSTLEENFQQTYGINAQVFRQSSGDVWLKTTTTDDLTLAEQNRLGEEMAENKLA